MLTLLVVTTGPRHGPQADDPPGVTGQVAHHRDFASKHVARRNVSVWLPPNYDANRDSRYPVIYMHDGQNLFDPKTSFLGVDWGVDEAMTQLIETGRVRPAIVVGVWNTPKRVLEYLPAKMIPPATDPAGRAAALDSISKHGLNLGDMALLSDEYLKFLVTELKPFIDTNYRSRPSRGHTFVMGSSAGALISLYAVCEYPDVFGGAGCVSTHWPVGDGLMIGYAKNHLPDPATHRLYFDFGTETLDRGYEPYQDKMDEVLSARGYKKSANWLTRKFAGADHSERSWRRRVDVPLEFMLGGWTQRH